MLGYRYRYMDIKILKELYLLEDESLLVILIGSVTVPCTLRRVGTFLSYLSIIYSIGGIGTVHSYNPY